MGYNSVICYCLRYDLISYQSNLKLGVFRVTPWEYSKCGIFRFLTVEYSATLNTPLLNKPDFYEIFGNSFISLSPM